MDKRLVKTIGISGVLSQVSRICENIDDRVQAFLQRLAKGDWLS